MDGKRRTLATKDLDLVAGLCGVEQSKEDGALSPLISCCLAYREGPKEKHWQPGNLPEWTKQFTH